MKFNTKIRNLLIILFSTLALSACSTAKKSTVGTSGMFTREQIQLNI